MKPTTRGGVPDGIEDLIQSAHVVSLRLATCFRGLQAREVCLVRGPAGWAEFSPFTEYDDHEAARWFAATHEVATTGLPQPLREHVAVNATIPAITPGEIAEALEKFAGARAVKIKVAERGQTLSDDIARVARCRELAGDDVALRVDANGGWSPDQARRALSELSPYRLEYAEQPVTETADLRELARWSREHAGVRVAADESIRKVKDPIECARDGGVDVAVVKMPPLGGPRAALDVAARLAEHDCEVVFSSALDSGVGLAAGIATAAATPHLPYPCGLGTSALFIDHITTPLVISGGLVAVPREVPAPDTDALQRFAAPPERQQWWRERLARCARIWAQTASAIDQGAVTS